MNRPSDEWHASPRVDLAERVRVGSSARLAVGAGILAFALLPPGVALGGSGCGERAGSSDGRDAGSLRLHPGFRYSEERQQSTSLWLAYQTDLNISAPELERYAEQRSKELCGGDFRYLSHREYPDGERETASFRQVEIVVECLR